MFFSGLSSRVRCWVLGGDGGPQVPTASINNELIFVQGALLCFQTIDHLSHDSCRRRRPPPPLFPGNRHPARAWHLNQRLPLPTRFQWLVSNQRVENFFSTSNRRSKQENPSATPVSAYFRSVSIFLLDIFSRMLKKKKDWKKNRIVMTP